MADVSDILYISTALVKRVKISVEKVTVFITINMAENNFGESKVKQ